MIIDKEDTQNIRLALAAVFMHARLQRRSTEMAADAGGYVIESIKDADALLAEFEKESP